MSGVYSGHGYIVALTSNVFARSFNDFYQQIKAFL